MMIWVFKRTVPASNQTRASIGPTSETPFRWRLADKPIVAQFHVLTGLGVEI